MCTFFIVPFCEFWVYIQLLPTWLSYNNVVDKLNLIFLNIDKKIKQDVKDAYNIKTRQNKLTYKNVLIYKFNYSVPNTTKEALTSSFNFKNDTTIDRTSFDYADNQIPLSSYMSLYKQMTSLYKQINNIHSKFIKWDIIFMVFIYLIK